MTGEIDTFEEVSDWFIVSGIILTVIGVLISNVYLLVKVFHFHVIAGAAAFVLEGIVLILLGLIVYAMGVEEDSDE